MGIDMNEDIRYGSLAKRLKDLNLKDAILSLHSRTNAPATYNRNKTRTPIDALWVSSNLVVERAGYMPIDLSSPAAPSDGHRMLWAKIDNYRLFGKDIPHSILPFKGTRLNSSHPYLCQKYNSTLKSLYTKHGVFQLEQDIKLLEIVPPNELEPERASRWDKLRNSLTLLCQRSCSCKVLATNCIRRVFKGYEDWSPKYAVIQSTIDLWRRIVKWKRGRMTSKGEIKKRAKRLNVIWDKIREVSLTKAKNS